MLLLLLFDDVKFIGQLLTSGSSRFLRDLVFLFAWGLVGFVCHQVLIYNG